jgi:hypothetical protein
MKSILVIFVCVCVAAVEVQATPVEMSAFKKMVLLRDSFGDLNADQWMCLYGTYYSDNNSQLQDQMKQCFVMDEFKRCLQKIPECKYCFE